MQEEQFLEKMKEMLVEEERLRVPVAQGLPWTTDEPEVSLSLTLILLRSRNLLPDFWYCVNQGYMSSVSASDIYYCLLLSSSSSHDLLRYCCISV